MKQHVNLVSFSFKHGEPPPGASILDCRKMRNPHHIERLKPLDGRHEEVREFVKTDPGFKPMLDDVVRRVILAREASSIPTIAFGCFGGRHRSVAMAELAAKALRDAGCDVSVTHRALS